MSINVAVTGLQATDNPAPGIGVVRCLKYPNGWDGKIIGLGYDVYDTGIYDKGLLDHTFLIPYPNQGKRKVIERLMYIHSVIKINVIIPTLDSEMVLYQQMEDELRAKGIKLFIPSRLAVEKRTKENLPQFCKETGIFTPKTVVIRDMGELSSAIREIGLPLMVKGVFYEADRCSTYEEAIKSTNRLRIKWGMPIILQEIIYGQEYDVCCVGGRKGQLLGSVAIRKTGLTEKGKAWSAITLKNDELIRMAKKVLRALGWEGPCELEILEEKRTKKLYLLEINPRFPAWIYVSTGAKQNLPRLVVELALGKKVRPLPQAKSGIIFVRHATDLVCPLNYVEQLTVTGELHY